MEFLKQISQRLLILDGNGSIVILEAIKLAHQFGFDIIAFPNHTLYALQPLDASCFQAFDHNMIYKGSKDKAMVRNDYTSQKNHISYMGRQSIKPNISQNKISSMDLGL